MKDIETILIKSSLRTVYYCKLTLYSCKSLHLKSTRFGSKLLLFSIHYWSNIKHWWYLQAQSVSSQICFVMRFASSIWIKYCILWSSCKVLPISTKLQLERIFFNGKRHHRSSSCDLAISVTYIETKGIRHALFTSLIVIC